MKKLYFVNKTNKDSYFINYEEDVENFNYENEKISHKLIFKNIDIKTEELPLFYSKIQNTYFEFKQISFDVSIGNVNVIKQNHILNLEITLERL